MASEWFIQAFKNGKEQYVYVEDIVKILSEYKIEKEYNHIAVKLYNNTIDYFFDLTQKQVSCLMISRPAKDIELENIIYKMMKLGNFIFFAPDGLYPIILKEEIENELSKDMTDSLGKPQSAKNEAEFTNLVNKIQDSSNIR